MRKLSSAALLALALAFPGAAFAAVSAGQTLPFLTVEFLGNVKKKKKTLRT